MVIEFGKILSDRSESEIGYDTQQVIEAFEERAKQYEERFPQEYRRVLGLSVFAWRHVVPPFVAIVTGLVALGLTITEAIR